MAAGLPCRVQGRHKASCQLRAGHRSKRKTVGDDLDAPLVLPLDKQGLRSRRSTLVATVAAASRQTRAAARSSGTAREHNKPEAWAGGSVVVTQSIEAAPARAECRDQRQLQAQAAQQHHTVTRRLEPGLGGSRQCCEHFGCERAGLGIQQGS